MKNALPPTKIVEFSILLLLGGGLLFASYLIGLSSLVPYSLIFAFALLLFRPTHFISPLAVIFAYYFIFFIIAPSFSQLHSDDDFSEFRYYLSFGMIFLVQTFASYGAFLGEYISIKRRGVDSGSTTAQVGQGKLNLIIFSLYISSTLFLYLIVQASGGFGRWIADPGEAFLNRAGSGVYVISSHMSTYILAGLVGYKSLTSRNRYHVTAFIIWILITSPVHGSKKLIITFLVLSLIPWVRSMRLYSRVAVALAVVFILIFFLGLYLRNTSWMTLEDAIPYALNYFTALRNLMLLVSDFDPGFLQTFFLPFNKFLSPFGLSDPSLYYDMNHMLTDKYFPTAWEIRATEQWSVEADLYLNFYFLAGLPVVFFYVLMVGWVYGRAQATQNIGIWIVSVILTLSLTSHLRGSIYNHTDFYMYPMLIVIYGLLKKFSIKEPVVNVGKYK